MTGKRCPKHPVEDTMVPCLGCGRDFCRVCDPPRGAGQYCPRCYQKSVSEIEEKKVGRLALLLRILPGRGAGKKAEGEKAAVTPAPGGGPVGREKPPESEERGKATRWPGRAASFVRGKAAGAWAWVKGLPRRTASWVARTYRDHFPLTLVATGRLEDAPPVANSWYKLLAIVIAGCGLWTVAVALSHERHAAYSIVVALLVAAAAVWALGARFSVAVGIITAMAVALSLVVGEILVQLLYKYDVIKTLDVTRIALRNPEGVRTLYRNFYYTLFVHRMLPSVLVAFFIGWWPLPRRPSWKGFRAAVTPQENAKEDD